MHISHLYWLLFSLYWAQGLPVGFMTHALPVILRSEGVSLAQIGGLGLLMLPWSVKILWAPWVDRISGSFGRYRSWILPSQLLTLLCLLMLAFFPLQALQHPSYLIGLFVLLLLMNLFGATQDIATDGLAVRLLHSDQQRWGNALQVIGSRLGFIVGGGLLLWSLEHWGWQISFFWLAALVLINTLPIACVRTSHLQQLAPPVSHTTSSGWIELKQHFFRYWQDPVLRAWFWVLLSFKVADGMAGPLLKPLAVDLGLSLSAIGLYITLLGAVAALVGAAIAAYSLRWLSRVQAFILFSLFKVLSLLAYLWLALQYEQSHQVAHELIYAINAFEDLCSAMLLMVMFSLIMQYCRTEWAATDFTFQVALMATISGLLYSLGGGLAELWGYSHTLILIIVLATLQLYPVWNWSRYLTRKSKNVHDLTS
ncbi:MFS transporter [Acinetobacter sp. GSS19]|uniref:MFS transporter n=1 Tax=Acinetobacter sp. GSS19 TaxID=3020716 RepID=UPI00235DCCD7|nr:MFS transporter [Acinetobacter sp. GSS19]